MSVYAIDASVVVKFLLKGERVVVKRLASLLRKSRGNKLRLISSTLLPLEVGNALRYSLRDKEKLNIVIFKFFGLPIEFINLSNSQIQEAIGLSFDLGTTVYDTSYHILAKANGAIFLTCDREYFKKAKKLGDIELVG